MWTVGRRRMNAVAVLVALMVVLASSGKAEQQRVSPAVDPAAAIAGAWSGTLTHDGETTPIALEFEPAADGVVVLRLTEPAIHVVRVPVVKAKPEVKGEEVRVGPFVLRYDGAAGTLTGVMPEALVPVYRIPVTLHRVERVEVPARPELTAPGATPAWIFDAGAPCWPGATLAEDVVLAGCDDGQLHAIDAGTGRGRWAFRAGGPIRTRATVSGGDAYVQADDGVLYKLSLRDGTEQWHVRVVTGKIERLPFDNPKSRFDRFGSDAAIADGRVYLGTHDGRVLAINPKDGSTIWEFKTGDAVLAAPEVAQGRVYVGSYDRTVYALDATTGRVIWTRDTQGAVVSTPALDGNRLVVGTRSYDLLGLDAGTGAIAWKRYIWFSWVESSPTLSDGIAYVGSSDAAAVFAFGGRDGRPVWKTDVRGWAWGQPAAAADRLYVGTSSQVGYAIDAHRGAALALDRKSGRVLWRFAAPAPQSGPYGFPGSAAVGPHFAFFAGLDGKVYAFPR